MAIDDAFLIEDWDLGLDELKNLINWCKFYYNLRGALHLRSCDLLF